jgi:hypothetical protein
MIATSSSGWARRLAKAGITAAVALSMAAAGASLTVSTAEAGWSFSRVNHRVVPKPTILQPVTPPGPAPAPLPEPSGLATPAPVKCPMGYTTYDTASAYITFLKLNGVCDVSMPNLVRIAAANGVYGYVGHPTQMLYLLNLIETGQFNWNF